MFAICSQNKMGDARERVKASSEKFFGEKLLAKADPP